MEITVCTDRASLLGELRGKCPSLTFVPFAEVARTPILIVDRAGGGRVPARGVEIVRIVLTGAVSGSRSVGDLHIDPEAFMRSVGSVLDFAADMVASAMRLRELEHMAETSVEVQNLLEASDIAEVCDRIAKTLVRQLSLSGGSLFFHEPVTELFELACSVNDRDAAETTLSTEILEELHQRVGSDLPHIVAPDGTGRQRLALPILVKEDVVGVFLGTIPEHAAVDRSAIRLALKYLDGVTAVLSNARQLSQNRDLAMRDDLTKAFNRRFFESYLDEEIERTRRYGSVFSIIFLDLDDLKLINNAHGHLTGSRVLQEVAKRILSAVRTIDKVVRFGGDEFCIILPETDKDQAMSVAMRVRKSMSATSFQLEPEIEVRITASFGIATYPNHALTKESLIRQADDAMYRVKSTTKNAIGIAGEFDANRAETAVS